MPDSSPLDDAGDDALADALADAWVERAASDPAIRRFALRAAGLAKAPAEMTRPELATHLGLSDRSLRRLEAIAMAKLRPQLAALHLDYSRRLSSPES